MTFRGSGQTEKALKYNQEILRQAELEKSRRERQREKRVTLLLDRLLRELTPVHREQILEIVLRTFPECPTCGRSFNSDFEPRSSHQSPQSGISEEGVENEVIHLGDE